MTTTPLSRRSALKMTGTAALGAAAFSLSACTDNGTAEAAAEVDQLTAQADRARSDAAAATAAGAPPDAAPKSAALAISMRP